MGWKIQNSDTTVSGFIHGEREGQTKYMCNSLLRGPGGGSNRDLFLGIITKERMEAK